MRSWLVDNGYLRSDAQVKRDELVKAINEKLIVSLNKCSCANRVLDIPICLRARFRISHGLMLVFGRSFVSMG